MPCDQKKKEPSKSDRRWRRLLHKETRKGGIRLDTIDKTFSSWRRLSCCFFNFPKRTWHLSVLSLPRPEKLVMTCIGLGSLGRRRLQRSRHFLLKSHVSTDSRWARWLRCTATRLDTSIELKGKVYLQLFPVRHIRFFAFCYCSCFFNWRPALSIRYLHLL